MTEKARKIWMKTKNNSPNQRVTLLTASIISIGIFTQFYSPGIVRSKIYENFKLTPNSSIISKWKLQSSPNDVKIFIFNWTNPNQITDRSIKPRFQQLGPYKFKEFPSKHNIMFHTENQTVSYKTTSTYFFDEDESVGSLDDILVALNLLAIAASSKIHHHGSNKKIGLSASLNAFNQQIHVTKSVREMLFDGYSDIMVTLGAILEEDRGKFQKIGFLVNKNGTSKSSNKFTINSGSRNVFKLGQLEKFNDFNELPFYEGECRKFRGSAGDFLPPNSGKSDVLYIFIPDLCRSLPFEYADDVKVNGIKGRRYVLGYRAIDNGTLYQENQCYSNESFPSGAINVTSCSFHQPTFVSYPHFYLADQSFSNAVDGFSPEKQHHESYIVVEPETSIILEKVLRLQTNIHMRQSDIVSIYKKVPNMLVPLFIVDQTYTIQHEDAFELKITLFVMEIAECIGYILILIGLSIIVVLGVGKMWKKKRNETKLYDMKLLVEIT